MDFQQSLETKLADLAASESALAQRITSEILFSARFCDLFADSRDEWRGRISSAAERVASRQSAADLEQVVSEAEGILAPIGRAAKEYTIHCVGHAHIDMDWSWTWLETIAICHDTFVTVDRLMDEFPGFNYSQPQISIYKAMEEYCPEVFEMISRRISEGRWEPVASMWVEGDKNMSSGESLCRHLLYSRRYLNERFGLPYDAIRIDWEGDTFGHARTVPAILSRGGVTRYYHCRTGPDKWLVWWCSPDGSRILRFFDMQWYGGRVTPGAALRMVDYAAETGLRDHMLVYGVGDHGGGPTRRDLHLVTEMNAWPIFPSLRLSTTDAFFSAVEKAGADLPVHDGELNYTFMGCYTSQSKAKLVNRIGESILPEVETLSLVAGAAVGFPYPAELIRKAWEPVMFNQFHDILAGSSEHEAMEEAVARFRQAEAAAGAIRIRALRKLAANVNTAWTASDTAADLSHALGFGDGDLSLPGRMSALSVGPEDGESVVVVNALPFARSEMVAAKVWNKDLPRDRIVVRDQAGRCVPGQVIGRGQYSDHEALVVLFPALDVPATGYKTFAIDTADDADVSGSHSDGSSRALAQPSPETSTEGVQVTAPGVIENEFVRVEVDTASGAIRHLIDKSSGYDYVPAGELMGLLEFYVEEPHNMSGWDIGRIREMTRLDKGSVIDESERQPFHEGSEGLGMVNSWAFAENGPNRAAVRTMRRVGDSRVVLEVALSAGSPAVDITVVAHWKEIGSPQAGVPMLRIAFPMRLTDPTATYEIPFGSIVRPTDGQEVPALRWADLSSKERGITVLNDCKHGHSADGGTLRVTLLRSSYDPDPVPEMGTHRIRLSLVPHQGSCSVADATRAAWAFNMPMSVVNTDAHEGNLPAEKGYLEVLTPNVILAAAKRAEDSDALIVRLYEVEGRQTQARVSLGGLVKAGCGAVEVDVMERPVAQSTARMEGSVLSVDMPAFGIASVAVGP